MKLKKQFFLILLSLFTFFNLYSEDRNLTGKALSDYIYTSLLQKKYSPSQMALSRSSEYGFPYNILFTIQKSEGFETIEGRAYNTVILSFSQEDIADRLDFIYNLIDYNLKTDLSYNVTILLSTSDRQFISGNEELSGTSTYAKFLKGTENHCALAVNLNSIKQNSITPGSEKKLSPLWLVKLSSISLEKNSLDFSIRGGNFVSLYGLGILRSSQKLSAFLSNGIPAVEMNLKGEDVSDENLLNIFSDFLSDFEKLDSFQNDIHYIPLRFFKNYYWLGERITVSLLLIFAFINLIIFCDFGFLFRKKHSYKNLLKKRAIKAFYKIPLIIILLTVFLLIAQVISETIYHSVYRNPIAALGIKVLITFIFISISYFVVLHSDKKVVSYVYEFLASIASLINIFIFSTINVSLFYLFALVYLIIFISTFFKNTVSSYIFLILSLVPYLLLVYETILYSNFTELNLLIFSGPLYNLLLACAITPFFILLLRILTNLRVTGSENSKNNAPDFNQQIKKKFPKYYALIQIVTFIILCVALAAIMIFLRNDFIKKIDFSSAYGNVIDSTTNYFVSASYRDSNYYGGTIREIKVTSSKTPVRIEVFVTGETGNPIYYTTSTYVQTSLSNQVKFDIPDFPPNSLKISYTPDNSSVTKVDVFAYYPLEDYPVDYISKQASSRLRNFVKEKSSFVINLNQLQGTK